MTDLSAFCVQETAWLVDLIRALVASESPSDDRAPLARCGDLVAERFAACGAAVERVAAETTAAHVLARWPGAGPAVLLLGHFDTVWPVGQLSRMPIREEGGRLYGPGVLDMKAGLGIGLLGVRALVELVEPAVRPAVTFLATADEEVGSRTSRATIETLARASAAVLVLEPALPTGAVKTARKGVGEFELLAHGVASHAGADPGAGASAIHEIAQQIGTLVRLNNPTSGLSVNVGVVSGGTRSNVVAEEARAQIDVRVAGLADAAAVTAAIRGLVPTDPRVRLEVRGQIGRPPMERSAGVARLFGLAQEVARQIGQNLSEGSTGGGSDGNFTAALGVPTLDGLGACGEGPHALHEHVHIKDLTPRAALLAGLLRRLGETSDVQ